MLVRLVLHLSFGARVNIQKETESRTDTIEYSLNERVLVRNDSSKIGERERMKKDL